MQSLIIIQNTIYNSLTKFTSSLIFPLFLAFLLLSSCQKEDESSNITPTPTPTKPDYSAEKQTSAESAMTITAVQDVVNTVEDAFDESLDGQTNGRIAAACGSVSHDKNNKSLAIDYGTGCESISGATKQGKIAVQYTGELKAGAMSWTITLTNYSLSGYVLNGNLKVQYAVKAGQNALSAGISTTGFSIVQGGKTLNVSTMDLLMNVSLGTKLKDQGDNATLITGKISGKNFDSKSFDAEITKDLLVKGECTASKNYLPVTGTLKVTIAGVSGGSVNFGTDTCDKKVQVTYPNGDLETIEF